MSDADLEKRRQKAVFDDTPPPSSVKAENMVNAIKWHTRGWSMVDAYTRAGVSKTSFRK